MILDKRPNFFLSKNRRFVKNGDLKKNLNYSILKNRFWFFDYNSRTDKDFLKIQKMADQVLGDH